MGKHFDKSTLDVVLVKCVDYLNANFHKFTQTEKIRVALELLKKYIGDKQDGEKGDTLIYNDYRTRLEKLGPIDLRGLLKEVRGSSMESRADDSTSLSES